MSRAFMDDWYENGRYVGYRVVDRNGRIAAQFPWEKKEREVFWVEPWKKARTLSDALNAGGIAREQALQKAEQSRDGAKPWHDAETLCTGPSPEDTSSAGHQ